MSEQEGCVKVLLLDNGVGLDGPFLSVSLSFWILTSLGPILHTRRGVHLFQCEGVRQRESGINSPVPKSERTKAHNRNERSWALKVAEVLRIPQPDVLTLHYL